MKFNFLKLFIIIVISNFFDYPPLEAKCGRDRVLRVGVLANNNPFFDKKNGTPFGFDVLLVREIASRLGYRNVKFIVEPFNLTTLFNKVLNNTIDFTGISNVVINASRLKFLGFVETDNNPIKCQPLVFLKSLSGIITSESTALDEIAANNIVVGSYGPGTIQYNTLIDHGVNPANIVNTQSFAHSFQKLFDHFGTGPGQYQALYFFKEKDVANEFVNEFSNTVTSFNCVDFSPEFQGDGDGYAFNKQCCNLMIQVQRVLNQIVADGTYARFVRQTLNNLCIPPEHKIGIGSSILIAPPRNISRQKGFIPTSCCKL